MIYQQYGAFFFRNWEENPIKINLENALNYLNKALNIVESQYQKDSFYIISVVKILAKVYMRKEEFLSAEKFYKRTITICQKFYGSDNIQVIDSKIGLCIALFKQNQLESSEQLIREVHTFFGNYSFVRDTNVFIEFIITMVELGTNYFNEGKKIKGLEITQLFSEIENFPLYNALQWKNKSYYQDMIIKLYSLI